MRQIILVGRGGGRVTPRRFPGRSDQPCKGWGPPLGSLAAGGVAAGCLCPGFFYTGRYEGSWDPRCLVGSGRNLPRLLPGLAVNILPNFSPIKIRQPGSVAASRFRPGHNSLACRRVRLEGLPRLVYVVVGLGFSDAIKKARIMPLPSRLWLLCGILCLFLCWGCSLQGHQ